MACIVTKDPDNTWYIYIDWSDWFADQIAKIGGTFTVTASVWFPDSGLSEEGTKLDDTTKFMYFYGSGGTVAGSPYDILNRITYTGTTTGSQVFTEDRTTQVRMKEK